MARSSKPEFLRLTEVIRVHTQANNLDIELADRLRLRPACEASLLGQPEAETEMFGPARGP